MKRQYNKSVAPEKMESHNMRQQTTPGFYRVLCLGLLLVGVVPGLFKLRHSFRGDQVEPADSAVAETLSSPTPDRVDSDSHVFRSQRRAVASTVASGEEPESSEQNGTVDLLPRLEGVLASASAKDRETAAALRRFAATGSMAELRALDRKDVESLAGYLAQSMSQEEIGSLLDQFIGLPATQIASQPGFNNTKETLVNIYDALSENYSQEVRPSALMITDECQPDGRITGQTHVIPAGTETVYAVFENDFSLAGLDQVMAVWRDPNDDRMVFTEFEPIRQGSAYNYVWLKVHEGWPSGRYQVELFHPKAQSLLLASESFGVR